MQKWKSFKFVFAPLQIFYDFDNDYYQSLKDVFPEADIKGSYLSHCKASTSLDSKFLILKKNNFSINLFIICASSIYSINLTSAVKIVWQ